MLTIGNRLCNRYLKFSFVMVLLLYFLTSTSCFNHFYEGKITDHYNGKTFYHTEKDVQFRELLNWFWTRKPKKWPKYIKNKTYPKPLRRVNKGISLTFVNHSTVLLQMDGINILTDPIWAERASPFSFVGPKRVREPGIPWDSLPPIDLVLLSHNHYDHMDLPTLRRLSKKFNISIYTGLGVKSYLDKDVFKQVKEFDWWDSTSFKILKITFVPARHNSQRSLFDSNKTLWGGFILESNSGTVYFAGDTGYGVFLDSIHARFPKIDIALLPIGAFEPKWFMHTHHMSPSDAVRAQSKLNAFQGVGIHFGTFDNLTDEDIEEPRTQLIQALAKNKLDTSKFWIPDFGEGRTFRPK